MSYLVIGAGSIGKRHHANLQALGAEVELLPWRGIDLNILRAAVADATGIVIATATDIRLDLIEMAAEAGKPIYIEKPLVFRTADLAAVKSMVAHIADRSVLGLMMRYHPAIRYLQADPVDAYSVRFAIGHDVRQWRENWKFSESYAAKPNGGGVLLDLCHELDMVHALYSDLGVDAVSCIGHANFPGVDFASEINLAGPGRLATVAMDYLAPKGFRHISLKGREDMAEIDLLTNSGTRWRGDSAETLSWKFERNDMFLDLMRDFMALAEGRAPSANPLLPRLDRVWLSARLTVWAWESRRFRCAIEGGFE